MGKDFYDAIEKRRTIYGINKDVSISNERIQKIVEDAIKYAPSAFNSQVQRAIVLLGKNHDKLWDITKGELKKIVPEDKFGGTEKKIDSFKSGYGTVLFFNDEDVTKKLQKDFATYKDNFPIWAHHASGILQYIVWTSLEIEGLGASLQHYNPLIDQKVKKEWNIPDSWSLVAEMPFGNVVSGPDDKEFQPLEERIKIFK